MKKRLAIIIIIIFFIILTVLTIILLYSKYNLLYYFDDWTNESNIKIANVISDDIVYIEDKKIDISDVCPGFIEEVYCISRGRIYFCYSIDSLNTWNIASIGLDKENFVNHYSCYLYDYFSKDDYICYKRLSYREENKNDIGGLYDNNKIYLFLRDKTIVYNIISDQIYEMEDRINNQYRWYINETSSEIIIEDCINNNKKYITLESMSLNNEYAKRLLELSSRKTWSGIPFTYKIFSLVKIVNNQIYIICEVFNWHGESTAVVFQYNFISDEVKYISSFKTEDRVESRYSFALCEP